MLKLMNDSLPLASMFSVHASRKSPRSRLWTQHSTPYLLSHVLMFHLCEFYSDLVSSFPFRIPKVYLFG